MSNKNTSNNILHIARRRIINPQELESILNRRGQTSARIGALPWNTIKNFSKDEIPLITQRADSAFSNFAKSIAESGISSASSIQEKIDTCTKPIEILENELKNIFGTDNISVTHLANGGFKMCFVIKIKDESYVLQTFFNQMYLSRNKFNHGAICEPQNIFTLNKNYSKGRTAHAFMARVSKTEFQTDAYIFMKYIPNSPVTKPLKLNRGHFVQRQDKFTSHDAKRFDSGNNISGVIVDMGDFSFNSNHITDKFLHAKWLEFAQILDGMDFNSEAANAAHNKLYAWYTQNPDTFFKTKKWEKITANMNFDEQKSAKKLLRATQKLKNKRELAIAQGYWPNIQNLLHQDFIKLFPFIRFNFDAKPPKYGYVWPYFYPRLIANILDISNIPSLSTVAENTVKYHNNKVDLPTNNGRIHWNKYYSMDEVNQAKKEHPEYDWSVVLGDFCSQTKKIFQKIFPKNK